MKKEGEIMAKIMNRVNNTYIPWNIRKEMGLSENWQDKISPVSLKFPFPADHTWNSGGADMPFLVFPDSCTPSRCQGSGVPPSDSLQLISRKTYCRHC